MEPCHVHVRRQNGEAKYWMDPIELADFRGFRPHELRDIERILRDHRESIVAAWLKVKDDYDDGSSTY